VLDADFIPAALYNQAFREEIQSSGKGDDLVFGLERADGSLSHFETKVFTHDHPWAIHNNEYSERILKFLLWQRGGWKVYVGGPAGIADYLQKSYAPGGERSFDYHFMGEEVYQKPFTIVHCKPKDVPGAKESQQSLGRHLEGCRIGFDLGASDVKVSAVIDGEAVFTHEMEWDPRSQADPAYHYDKIMAML
jgi:hypothetical protein